MKTFGLLFIIVCILCGKLASCGELDQSIVLIKEEGSLNPFNKGESEALKHPVYKKLFLLSKMYGSVIEWHNSVSKRVLGLPYSPDRMKIKVQDEFDGWFDEYTKPNLIIIHQEASLVTLVHELRHALHLGGHKILDGNWFDVVLQKNKKKILKFHEFLEENQTSLSQAELMKIKKVSTRLLETCSEISAHQGDLILAREFDSSFVDGYKKLIQGYKNEFNRSYNYLIKNKNSENEPFIKELKTSLDKFLKE